MHPIYMNATTRCCCRQKHNANHEPKPWNCLAHDYPRVVDPEAHDDSREEELNRLLDAIKKLSELFEHLKDMIEEQGKIVDSIDKHVMNAVPYVKKAMIHLKNAEVITIQGRKCKTYAAIGSLLFLLALIVVTLLATLL